MLGCGFPALAVMTWFLVTAPVIGAEGLGPIAAMRRSARLVSRRFWRVLGLALLSRAGGVAASATRSGLVPTVLALFVGTDGLGWLLSAAAAMPHRR